MGNADAEMLNPTLTSDLSEPFKDIIGWCAQRPDDTDRTFIRTFRETVRLELDGFPILCFHGSPKSYNDVITATTPDEALGMFFETRAPLMCGGHTHTQLLRRFQNVTFVNPGSVGLPHEVLKDGSVRNPARAEYALVEINRGQPSVTFRRVSYDLEPLLEAVRTSGMPHAETWSADWSGEPAP